jgi:hypothetical protein
LPLAVRQAAWIGAECPPPLRGGAAIPKQHSVRYIFIGKTNQQFLMDFSAIGK